MIWVTCEVRATSGSVGAKTWPELSKRGGYEQCCGGYEQCCGGYEPCSGGYE